MEGAPQPDRLSQAGLADFAPRADAAASPVVMLNLLAFEPGAGRERYAEYGEAVAPLLEEAGGRVLFAGDAAPPLIGEAGWDMVLLVEYPTRRAFLEMTGSEAYLEIAHLRTEGLERAELHPLGPAPGVSSGSTSAESGTFDDATTKQAVHSASVPELG
jgi:uncharacterized protein (DUF1330 family)